MGEVQASRGGGAQVNVPAEQNTFDNDRNKRADWLRPDVLAAREPRRRTVDAEVRHRA